jgi:hypothetical protein
VANRRWHLQPKIFGQNAAQQRVERVLWLENQLECTINTKKQQSKNALVVIILKPVCNGPNLFRQHLGLSHGWGDWSCASVLVMRVPVGLQNPANAVPLFGTPSLLIVGLVCFVEGSW